MYTDSMDLFQLATITNNGSQYSWTEASYKNRPLAAHTWPILIFLTEAADIAIPIHHLQAISNGQQEMSASISLWQVQTSHSHFTLHMSMGKTMSWQYAIQWMTSDCSIFIDMYIASKKNRATIHSFLTLTNVGQFPNSFTVIFSKKFATKPVPYFPPNLKWRWATENDLPSRKSCSIAQ